MIGLAATRRGRRARRGRDGLAARGLRAAAGAAAVVLAAAACVSSGPEPDRAAAGPGPSGAVSLAPVEQSPREQVPSALRLEADPAFPAPLVDPARIISGGPPPDGIPPVDEPLFERASEVRWLADTEAVIALEVGDDAPTRCRSSSGTRSSTTRSAGRR